MKKKRLQKQISYLTGSISSFLLIAVGVQFLLGIGCIDRQPLTAPSYQERALLKLSMADDAVPGTALAEVESLRFLLSSDSLAGDRVYTFAFTDGQGVAPGLPVGIVVDVRVEGLSADGRILFWGARVCTTGTDSALTITFTAQHMSPIAPDGIVAVAKTVDSITVTWQDLSNNEDYFVLERSVGSAEFAPLCTVTTAFYVDTVGPSQTYTYRVYAVNSVSATLAVTSNSVTTNDVDSVAPVIAVLSSVNNPDTTNKKLLRLFGTAGDESGLSGLMISYQNVTDSIIPVTNYQWVVEGILLDEGDNVFTLVAGDNAHPSNVDTLVYTIYYSPEYIDSSNHPPQILVTTTYMRATQVAGLEYRRVLLATDEDEYNTFTFETCSLLTVDDSGIITWTPTNADTGVNNMWAVAVDQDGAVSDTLTWTITVLDNSVNHAPKFTTSAGSLLDSILVDSTYIDTVEAEDYDQTSGLVYSKVSGPNGLGVNSENGAVTYIPPADDLGSQPVTIEVVDDSGATARISWVITVYDPAAPIAFAGDDDTVSINDMISLSGVGSPMSGNPITSYEWDIGNTGTFVAGSRDTTFVAPSTPIDTLRCVLRVTDAGGNWNKSTVTITVLKDDPVPDAGEDQIVQINETITLNGSATDAYGEVVKYEWKIGSEDWVTSADGSITFEGPSASGPLTCVLRVTDDDGNEATDNVVINVIGSTMRLISVGGASTITYGMGSTSASADADESPRHTVTINKFMIDSTEVNLGEYKLEMGNIDPTPHGDLTKPVVQVTWFDAVLYCNARSARDGFEAVYSYDAVVGTPGNGATNLTNLAVDYSKVGYRLPTEAEWEYACRGADVDQDFFWGNDNTEVDTYAWYSGNASGAETVAQLQGNPLDLYDMAGNVAEWVTDWYSATYYADYQTAGSPANPAGPDNGDDRVIRGGSWNGTTLDLRSAARSKLAPYAKAAFIGFRCVLPVAE